MVDFNMAENGKNLQWFFFNLFTYVRRVDCFGPCDIVTGKTRGGSINSKRCAALFCCLSLRAAHIETKEEMSNSSFINALRDLITMRWVKVKEFSSKGTYFLGGTKGFGCKLTMLKCWSKVFPLGPWISLNLKKLYIHPTWKGSANDYWGC